MKLIGFGKGVSGKGHVHVIVQDGIIRHALCDKRNANVAMEKKFKQDAITCPKCSKHSFMLQTDTKEVPKKVISKKPDQPKKAVKPKPKAKEKPKAKAKEKSIDATCFIGCKKQNGCYLIQHTPTGKDFFDNIDSRVAPLAIEMLNLFEQKWEKDKPLPEKFISNIRSIVKAAYASLKIKPPKHLKEKPRKTKKKLPRDGDKQRAKIDGKFVIQVFSEKIKDWMLEVEYIAAKQATDDKAKAKEKKKTAKMKKKTTIKRRPAKEKTKSSGKIKRRVKAESNEYGQIIGKPPEVIVSMMRTGATLGEIASRLTEEFGITEKRAITKVKGSVRKSVRKRGFLINVSMKSDDIMNDHYKIVGKESTIKRRKK